MTEDSGSRCSGCGAPVLWAINIATDKAIPLNATPEPAGRGRAILVDGDQSEGPKNRPRVKFLRNGETAPYDALTYSSHFASCPEADSFRKKGRK